MKTKLNLKEAFVFAFLLGHGGFVSPGLVGAAIWDEFNTGSGHSSTGSPICKKLVGLGFAERNEKGHYKGISQLIN